MSKDFLRFLVLPVVIFKQLQNCHGFSPLNNGLSNAASKQSYIKILNVSKLQKNKSTIVRSVPREEEPCSLSSLPVIVHTAIVGAGPSGLVLAHYLLSSSNQIPNVKYKVSLFESRSDPRVALSASSSDGRAYALGLGCRGRTAIESIPTMKEECDLWNAVRKRGFLSDKFQLYFTPTRKITLRDDSTNNWKGNEKPEPSLLIYQTDLCSALLDQLEQSFKIGDDYEILFDAKVSAVDLIKKHISVLPRSSEGNLDENMRIFGPFDLIVGCDGVNSKVRDSIIEASQGIITVDKNPLPGIYKVARLDHMPSTMEPTAVALVMPSANASPTKTGSDTNKPTTTLFVEPVINGGACILFAGRDGNDPLLLSKRENVGPLEKMALARDVLERFPLLDATLTKDDIPNVIDQLLNQNPASASSVWCNTYNFLDRAVLCGDAAHCTGGVSGQGVNSALMDSKVLGKCLTTELNQYASFAEGLPKETCAKQKQEAIRRALDEYSIRQVPEGHALYEMSVGVSPKPLVAADMNTSATLSNNQDIFLPLKQAFRLFNTALDTVFGGRFGIGQPPIQTRFTTTLESFASIRRSREIYFDQVFPDEESYRGILSSISDSIANAMSVSVKEDPKSELDRI